MLGNECVYGRQLSFPSDGVVGCLTMHTALRLSSAEFGGGSAAVFLFLCVIPSYSHLPYLSMRIKTVDLLLLFLSGSNDVTEPPHLRTAMFRMRLEDHSWGDPPESNPRRHRLDVGSQTQREQ